MRERYPFIWSNLKPFRWLFLSLGVVLFAQIFLTILAPLPIKFILNNVVKADPGAVHEVTLQGFYLGTFTGGEALLNLSFLAFAIGTLLTIAFWIESVWLGNLSFRINELIRRDLFARIFTRRQTYLDSKKKVDLLGRVSGDVTNLETLITNGVPAVVRDVPMIVVLLAMMFLINFRLALVFTICLPIFYLLGYVFTSLMHTASRLDRRRTIKFEEETYEAMNSLAIVKSLRGEEKLTQKILGRAAELTDSARRVMFATQGLEATLSMAHYIVRGGFIFLGVWAIFRGEIGLGDLFQLTAYMETLSRYINNINKFISKYPKCVASMERIEELNAQLNLYPETSGELPLTREMIRGATAAASFRELTFQHGESRKIFDRFTFDFPKGELIAVVGQSGIGKSTFSRLLNRLSDPVGGRVEIAGEDLRNYDLKQLRSLVRVLSQEVFLVSGTVRENLLLAVGRPVSDEEIAAALSAVNASGFVAALPQGIDTQVGEGGLQLSGGQAKRIHLARAFLDLESEIILFDEPTTGLDTLTAQMVIESIEKLARAKTLVLMVTHRMVEVYSADRVLFFSANQNPLFSSHEDLFRTNALYRALMEDTEKSPLPNEREKPVMPAEEDTDEDAAEPKAVLA
jgi:ATP-binding cassette, subfamily B, bacterial